MLKGIKIKLKEKLGVNVSEFFAHSKNYITADFFQKGLAFISVPIYTRILSLEDYGILAVFFSFISLFSIFGGLGFRGSITRYYYEKNNDFDSFYSSTVLSICIWNIFLFLLIASSVNYLKTFFNIPITMLIIGGLVIFSRAPYNQYLGYLQASKNSKRIMKLNMINSVATLVLGVTITILLQNDKFYGKAISNIIIAVGFLFLAIYSKKINLKSFISRKYLKYALIFGIPTVFHLLAQSVLTNFDQIIINQLVGSEETGLYSFAYNVGMLQNIFVMGMASAYTPMFYENFAKRNFLAIDKLFQLFSKLVLFIAISLILFAKEIVVILADQKFYSSLNIVPIIVISYVVFFFYMMIVSYEFYYKKNIMISIFTIIAGGVNIGLNYLLIPIYGYKVAAVTTVISYILLFILHFTFVKYYIKPEKILNMLKSIPSILYFFIALFLYYVVVYYINIWWISFLLRIIIFTLATVQLFDYKAIKTLIIKK